MFLYIVKKFPENKSYLNIWNTQLSNNVYSAIQFNPFDMDNNT